MRPSYLDTPYSRRRRNISRIEAMAWGVLGGSLTAMFLLIVKGITL